MTGLNFFGLGYRKPYIVIGLSVQAICLIIIPLVDPGKDYYLFALMAFILMSGMALYDTCTDGLALDTTAKEDEGTIQGFMVGGRAVGVVLISAVIGLLVEKHSWSIAFYALGILTLLPLPLVFAAKEATRRPDQKFEWKAFSAFAHWPIIALGLLGALYSLVIYGANEIVNPFLSTRFAITPSTAGFVTTVWGLGVVISSVAGGRLTDRWGQHKSVLRAMLLSLVAVALLGLAQAHWQVWPLVFLFGLAFGFYETVYFAIAMNNTNSRIAASMFSILMALANVGTGVGMALTGTLVDSIGYPLSFVVLAVLNLVALPLLPAIFGRRTVVQVEPAVKG